MTDRSGPALFCRYAFPPNSLGYCGPSEAGLMMGLIDDGLGAIHELRHVIPTFSGAWPYLELIAACSRRDPLDAAVVEAYWLGGTLLDVVDLPALGNSMEERFRKRAGWDWEAVTAALTAGGRPTHSFHVFCIYPWVGLLQSEATGQALEVLEKCRIRWGEVVGRTGDRLLVDSQPLTWDGYRIELGPTRLETVLPPVDDQSIETGDLVSMHWDYVCERITLRQQRVLKGHHDRHLALANQHQGSLAARIEG